MGRSTTRAHLLLLVLALCCGSCASWQSADGTRHTLILGVGLVSTKSAPGHAATAVRSHILGLTVQGSPHAGIVVGYQSLQQTVIPSEWEGVLEIETIPGYLLKVEGHTPACPPLLPATPYDEERP